MACLANMRGKLMPVRIQGTVESILLARATSRAAALKGSGKSCLSSDELTGAPGWTSPPLDSWTLAMRWGERSGEEKESK